MLHGVVELLPTVGYVSVVLLGVVQCSREIVETCAPRSYSSSEGEDRLQYAGLSSKVPVVGFDGLCAGRVCLLLNGLMLGQIVLALVQPSEFLFDHGFETAFALSQFRHSS